MSKVDRKSPEYLESISFRNLVKAIDEKWSHTYEPVKLTEEEEIEVILEKIRNL